MDLTITVPRQQFFHWRPYLETKKDYPFYFRIPYFPLKMEGSRRCYVIYKGRIVGFFYITAFMQIKHAHIREGMTPGYYLLLNACRWSAITPIPTKSHRGFKYMESTDHIVSNFTLFLDKIEEVLQL